MPRISNEQIRIFLSLFKGREDEFAIRWGKDGKSGYMPAYDLNWDVIYFRFALLFEELRIAKKVQYRSTCE